MQAVLELTGGRGADVIITAAASGQAQEQALQMVAPQGRISFFGGLPKDRPTITLDSNVVHYKELTIKGANGSSPAHNKEALAMIADGGCRCPTSSPTGCRSTRSWTGSPSFQNGTGIKVTIEP